MTDKQIACIYLARRLWGLIPDHDELRDLAESQLSEERCYRICQRITDMCTKLRQPLVDHLNRSGIETT